MSAEALQSWMDRALVLLHRAKRRLGVEVVHDLRTSLRRVRSLVAGVNEMVPDPLWRDVGDAARPLFRGLGLLRDAHVLAEHVAKLCKDELLRERILAALDDDARILRVDARAALVAFDVEHWRTLTAVVPARIAPILSERALFEHLALRRLHDAHALHRAALRNRTATSAHALRIGVKRLRYTIESFLPDVHDAVGGALKKMQTWLGDVHDLDVLRAVLPNVDAEPSAVAAFKALVERARAKDLGKYRAHSIGPASLWARVDAAVPDGDEAVLAGLRRLSTTTLALDPDGLFDRRARRIFAAVGLVHDVKPRKIRKQPPVPGLDARDLALVAGIAGGKSARVDPRDVELWRAGVLALGRAREIVGVQPPGARPADEARSPPPS